MAYHDPQEHCGDDRSQLDVYWRLHEQNNSFARLAGLFDVGQTLMAGKGKKGDGAQYVPLPYAQLKSSAWRSLSGAAVKLLLELHTRYNGGNNGKLHLSMNEAAEILGLGKATVKRAYDELIEKGFLVLETEGDWYSRRAHEWRLTTKPMQSAKGKSPPTLDWATWKAPDKAKRIQ